MKTIEEIKLEHLNMIYPTVRVRTDKAGGSGLIIYSKPTPDNPNKHETYVLTCNHVIEDAIKFVKQWSGLAQRYKELEDRAIVQVEVFEYEALSRVIGGTTYQAEIMAWNKESDLALLRIKADKGFSFIAKLYPKGKEDEIKLGMETCACGCSLGHEPILNYGNLMAKHDIIENKEYWMSTANSIFGNSGGAEFLKDTHEFIGVTARISGIQIGFGVDIITWMGFFVPIATFYKFVDDEIFQFIYDPNYTSKMCEELRQQRREEEERKLLLPPSEKVETKAIPKYKQEEPSHPDPYGYGH